MAKKIKNIFNLTKIFFQNSFQNPYIIDKKTNKINKKSIFVWLMFIVIITITLLSYKIINELYKIGQAQTFLNAFLLILNIIMIFQVILASTNVYFFSKDLELVLPLPIKTEELLIAKFNTILINLYFTELIFAFLPLINYGIITNSGIIYYLFMVIVLLIFPLLTNLIISIIMMFLVKLSKFIKNKDIFQIIISFIFILFIFLLEIKIMETFVFNFNENAEITKEEIVQAVESFDNRLEKINNYFLILNPTVEVLNNYNKIDSLLNIAKIIFINFIFIILFIFVGKKYYLKNILKNNNSYFIKQDKKNNKIKIEKKSKKTSKRKAYLKKDFRILFRSPIFFMQCVFPTIILMVSTIIIVAIALPNIRILLTSDILGEEIEFSMSFGVVCIVLEVIQILFAMSNLSITAISREGKNAIYMKSLPLGLYKQFIYKSMPQILMNAIIILIVTTVVKMIFPEIEFIYLIFIFILANLLSILNSNLMVAVDLYRPKLNWNAEYEAIKNNNKIFQYALTIIIILLLIYFHKVLEDINLTLACFCVTVALLIIILIVNKIIKINIKKLYKKII